MGDAVLLTVSAPPRVLSRLRAGQFFNIVTPISGVVRSTAAPAILGLSGAPETLQP